MEDSTKKKMETAKAETKSWVRAVLEAEPCIVTQKGLLFALKHNAPLPVIRFMLKINPNIMNFPKVGPTPLQVAVRHNAELDVVRMLLDASAVGECIRNVDFPESPLEYAKRCCSDRTDLIELLSRKSKNRDQKCQKQTEGKVTFQPYSSPCIPLQQTTKKQVPLLSPPPSFSARRARASSIISSSTTSEPSPPLRENVLAQAIRENVLAQTKNSSNSNDLQQPRPMSHSPTILQQKIRENKIDREEMNNVKALCVHLWKSHRKMAKHVNSCKNDVETHSKLLATIGTKEEILDELMKQQRSQMFRNWIALDTKERAYQNRLEKMEQRYVQQLEKRLDSWTGSMRLWNESTREQLQELQAFVDSEAEINEEFRSNMTDWIEKYQQDKENNVSIPSHVYATNLGEVNERVPLCTAFREAFCGYATDTTDGDTDPIIGVEENLSPLKRVKKRPWRPLFKNRDRIPLSEER
jgi:hypothetical protein